MENCNTILSIHSGMGATQNDRYKAALQTDFFLLDERNEQDFILFVQKLSRYVMYYDGLNIEDGNWAGFFEKESTSILILIADWNIELLQNSFESKKNEILLNTDLNTQQQILTDYFKSIENEYNKLLGKARDLDNDISEKQNLTVAAYSVNENFNQVFTQISNATDMEALFKSYVFAKASQQLFGMLLSWKNFSKNAIEYQLNKYSKHTPHYALFLSFLKLLNIAKEKLNEFTKKHLDFYYKDILRVENQTARPDYAHLVVAPYDASPFLITKNTIFPAGKNTAGQKKYFASTADQTINGIQLHSLYSEYRKDNQYFKTEDLLPFNAQDKGFNAFSTTATESKEGIMIASPLLYLQSGERTIKLRFNATGFKASDFSFFITGEKKIIELSEGKDEGNYIVLTIPATEKKIIPFNKEIHPEILIKTEFPVLKIVPDSRTIIPSIDKIEIIVSVAGFKSFVLTSDLGAIDTEKPFYPFSEFPKTGNGITLESNEFFMKKNAVAFLGLVPDGQSDNYFDVNTKKFFLNKGKYTNFAAPDGAEARYYKAQNTNTTDHSIGLTNHYPLKEFNFEDISDNGLTSNGKFRIELNHTDFDNETFMKKYIEASKASGNLPYKPKIKEFIFNYSVSEVINLNTRTNENNPIELYQVLPYGFLPIEKGTFYFSDLNVLEGAVYLGFENVSPKDGLTFLLQLEEGTANPLLESAKISWEYLDQNKWISFEPNAIGDETYSLTQSGLVNVSIPQFNASSNTMFPADLFWIKISVSNIQAVCQFIGIHAQALKAVLTDYEETGNVFSEITPAKTINSIYDNIVNVKKIEQPYPSFGGRPAEKDNVMYQRISERLRHKNRAITSWDYERIILEEFPEIFRVKVLNHYRYDTQISNTSAGFVTLIPIAKTSNTENINWKPMLSLNKMTLIKKHLSKMTSPHVRINVKPPKLEKVEVQFKVKFRHAEGMDTRLYISELTHAINRYLSPWAYDDHSEMNFANDIEFSSVIQLVDNQYYVDYITDFKITQYVLDENGNTTGSPVQNLSKITPQTDFSLFVPSESYPIQEI
ncbi:baseplate J/gp47 family protein [Chryseobacterium kwangjuense]|uniref:Uncharacterized protein n=1 Tax=Chryseobacterium kwangjuense TaxID=267125 RepID=A0A135W2K9_9FLAO|nr:baseplate J/gp47 family protein [Chryseobacterium kwangjuense]KXH79145.1 hypothetical protein AU378_21075 [Chryseobacterium kwangjuense]